MSLFTEHCKATSLTNRAPDQPQVGERNGGHWTESGPLIDSGGRISPKVFGYSNLQLLTKLVSPQRVYTHVAYHGRAAQRTTTVNLHVKRVK